MLELHAVNKTFSTPAGPIRAVIDCSLSVGKGEFVAVCGPSGCGKSTLMLMAGGLLRPDSGTLMIDGVDVYGLAPSARAKARAASIGFVFQQFHLLPYLSAYDNIRVPAMALTERDAREVGVRTEELLRKLGLEQRRDHVPARLSVGEQQRVALGRALVNEPSVVLADEPTGNLDPASINAALACLGDYVTSGGSVLLVTHDDRAARAAGGVVQMEQGRITG